MSDAQENPGDAEAEVPPAGDREYRIERPKRRGSSRHAKLLAGFLGVGTLALLGYGYVVSGDKGKIETSGVEEFQESDTGAGFGRIGVGETEKRETQTFDFGPIRDQLDSQRSELEQRNTELQRQVRDLQDNLAGLSKRAEGEQSGLVAELTRALEEAQAQNAALDEQMRAEFANAVESLQAESEKRLTAQDEALQTLRRENLALQEQLTSSTETALAEQQERALAQRLTQQREAELAERRRIAATQLEARVRSASVVYDGGSAGGSGGSGTGASIGASRNTDSRDATLRDFVTSRGEAVPVEAAGVIANPAQTVLQGTLIQATLENAVDSALPGQVSAVVNYPVWSFDQSQVLIPSGSRVFGSYSSDVSIGQGRILVGWTRLVTPDGQSVNLSAFGGDQMGRSGITGRVNTRFGTRFGNAALISLVGAMPAVAAAEIQNDTGSEIVREVSGDFADTTNAAAAEYATLPPIITVEQGAAITIMVDRDLEFF